MGEMIAWLIMAVVIVVCGLLALAALGVVVWLVGALVAVVAGAAATGAAALVGLGYVFVRYIAPVLLVVGLFLWIASAISGPSRVPAPPPVATAPPTGTVDETDAPTYEQVLEELRAETREP